MRKTNVSLSDRDVDVIFKTADADGNGKLGIDEFFINFRHDTFPRERFFWSKQAGGPPRTLTTHPKSQPAPWHDSQPRPAPQR